MTDIGALSLVTHSRFGQQTTTETQAAIQNKSAMLLITDY